MGLDCSPQGGVPTATKKCPLYSDSKALLATELARAAEEAREKLKKDNVKLDIDPLRDIPEVSAQPSVDHVRAALFEQWVGLNQVSYRVKFGKMNR